MGGVFASRGEDGKTMAKLEAQRKNEKKKSTLTGVDYDNRVSEQKQSRAQWPYGLSCEREIKLVKRGGEGAKNADGRGRELRRHRG